MDLIRKTDFFCRVFLVEVQSFKTGSRNGLLKFTAVWLKGQK